VSTIAADFPDCARLIEPAIDVPGGQIDQALEPRSAEELAAVLATAAGHKQSVVPMGGRTRLGIANPLQRDAVGLSLSSISGIDEFDAADGVAHVRAGTTLREISATVEPAGWLLPFDPPGSDTTIGGTLACAAAGPQQLGLGPVRHGVLGLEVVLASGQRAKCGARVVKNVTGYDMAKLYVGSYGTLCVIEGAWLRLQPAPRQIACVAGAVSLAGSGITLAIEAARRYSARAVALVDPALLAGAGSPPELVELAEAVDRTKSWIVVCEWAGDEVVCREDAGWLAERVESVAVPASAIDALRGVQSSTPVDGIRARLHVLPDRLHECSERLRTAGARVMLYPVPGTVFAFFGAEPGQIGPALSELEALRSDVAGELVIESLPTHARPDCDVFRGVGDGLSLMRGLKARFDPDGILSPGRFMGGI
jgi:glycolate oxidase FAD binding subunit